jgi:hypothetical protein
MFSFSPGQGLVEHILADISRVMIRNYVKRKKGERKKKEKDNKKENEKREEKEKCSIVFVVLKILC